MKEVGWMMVESRATRLVPRVFWACTLVALVCWSLVPGYVVGWDVAVYKAAMDSLRVGHDPYLDATNIQRVFHAQGAHPPGTATPFAYVYSPITLPLLRAAMHVPLWLSAAVYWAMFVVAVFAAVWVGYWAAEGRRERTVFAFLAPVAVFFPGLLQQDVFFSGNVAYILYGAVLMSAWWGWTRRVWWPFYAAVVVASCFKAPLLSLVVIAPLSAERQWVKAGVACCVGVGLFLVQPRLWPSLFANYMTAVELQFSFNKDFSSSPAGLVAKMMFDVAPYKVVWAVVYGVYAVLIAAVLLRLRGRFLRGEISLRQWAPSMLVGTILLNPRIMEYDVAPITLMMALVAWRFFEAVGRGSMRVAVVGMAVMFAVGNGLQVMKNFTPDSWDWWRPTEGVLLVALFVVGSWTLWRERVGGDAERWG